MPNDATGNKNAEGYIPPAFSATLVEEGSCL